MFEKLCLGHISKHTHTQTHYSQKTHFFSCKILNPCSTLSPVLIHTQKTKHASMGPVGLLTEQTEPVLHALSST